MNERARCPNPVCPQPDDVQKVSVVAASWNALNLLGVPGQLQAPERPQNYGRWGLGSIILLLVLAFFASPVVTEPLAMIRNGAPLVSGPNPETSLLVLLGDILVSVGLMVWLVVYMRSASNRFKHELRAWERAWATWNQLYYCNRCGSVFNPDDPTHRFVPASRMKELLV
jgi:hypothetical protein